MNSNTCSIIKSDLQYIQHKQNPSKINQLIDKITSDLSKIDDFLNQNSCKTVELFIYIKCMKEEKR
ncbi:hypothetical protein HanIR_Chr05g0247781 [Helianthus annuus]|nr:hypothetical protein HanIR_Chr05g0247781 [Helianthus annuus]